MGTKQKFNNTIKDPIGCFALLLIIGLIGWILNFQNLWEYWPAGGMDDSLITLITNLPVKWIISCVGVFLFPVGVVTGYIW